MVWALPQFKTATVHSHSQFIATAQVPFHVFPRSLDNYLDLYENFRLCPRGKERGTREPDGWADPWLLFPDEAGVDKEGAGGGREKSAIGRSHHAPSLFRAIFPPALSLHHLTHHSNSFLTLVGNSVQMCCLRDGSRNLPTAQSCFQVQASPLIPLQSCRVSGSSRRTASNVCPSLPIPCL